MYFDSWSTSYFFWVIICFAVWGMAGFSVYGAINVFTSRNNKYKKQDPLTPERIQELKWKAVNGVELLYPDDAKQKLFDKEKKATVKSVEAFVNSFENIPEEKQEVKGEKIGGGQEEAFSSKKSEPEIYEKKKEPDHEKLREIYEKEIKKAQETISERKEVENLDQKIVEEDIFIQALPKQEVSKIEKTTDVREKHSWQEIDDVVRVAFRS